MTSSNSSPPRRSFFRRLLRFLAWAFVLIVVLAVASVVWFRSHVGQSLAILDGEIALDGLAAPVTVERDHQGVPTIRAESRADVSRALGFLHGQDRFFQMDLIRRRAAGELSELVGKAALGLDRRVRLHRFRTRAQEYVNALGATDRQLLDAYVEGVNAGLSALDATPFEYTLLRTDPEPWRHEDTLLAVYAMYLDLQGGSAQREMAYGVVYDVLPPALAEFLTPEGTDWDSPIDGELLSAPAVPTPEEFDLRSQPPAAEQKVARFTPEHAPTDDPYAPPYQGFTIGSNNWAVAGNLTAHGGALLADDMHLGHDVPNIWYRASFVFPDPDSGSERRVTGVTLPGAMLVIAGSNGEVAWGFTNTGADFSDLVIIEPDPNDPQAYLTPHGPQRFLTFQEELRAGGETIETLEIKETIWGPVWDTDHEGRQRALRWVAHDDRGVNLVLREMETASNLDEAIAIAGRAGIPGQNFVAADRDGRIGWTVMGPIPRRFGHDGTVPTSWADGSRGWDGWLWPEEYPRMLDPESGRLWTANNRVVSGEMLAKLGDGGYDLGARAKQIRDGLFALEQADEKALLAIQLDDRALFLERWQKLLLDILTPEAIADHPKRQELRRVVEDWNGHASVDSAAYRLVRGFRFALWDRTFQTLTAPCREAEDRFRFHWLSQYEGPLWRLASEQPPNLLDPQYDTWQEQFLAAVDGLIERVGGDEADLASMTWGSLNRLRIMHPLSRALPFAGRWLDMPRTPAPGDANMPRVQGQTFGASERLVVSPGREDEGIFHMPTGQSGHPKSPFFTAGHEDWVEGRPSSFLPGATAHTLTLTPSGA